MKWQTLPRGATSWRYLIGIITIVVAILLIGWQWVEQRDEHVSTSGWLGIATESLELGEIWETDSYPVRLTIRNTTESPLEIEGFEQSCACVRIEPEKAKIEPGERCELRLWLNLSLPLRGLDDNHDRPFAVTIAPRVTNAQRETRQEPFTLHATVKTAISMSDTQLYMPDISRLANPEESRTIVAAHVMQGVKDIVVKPEIDCNWIAISTARDPDSPNVYKIQMKLARVLSVGIHKCRVAIHPIVDGVTQPPIKYITIRCQIINDIQAYPRQITLGHQLVGTEAIESITLRSLTGRSFHIKSVHTTNGITLASKRFNSKEGVCHIKIKCNREGMHSEKVTIAAITDEGASCDIFVPIAYHGMAKH